MWHDYDNAYRMATNLYREFFTDNPHRYLKPEDDGVDVPEGAIIADVGGAEGLFGMTFIDRIKKLYVFESEPHWISKLEKTFAPFKDKVVIVQGTVGDRPEDIRLDDYFADKEKPTVVKMDIEGYEPFALNGMTDLINSDDPLTMLICTYHRQSDWNDFYGRLHERFTITSSEGYFWFMPDPMPPFFRHGVMRAVKNTSKETNA